MPRRTEPVENAAYVAMMRRLIRAHGRRVSHGDLEDLAELRTLHNALVNAERDAVSGLRDQGYSWGAIAGVLGISRQAAWEQYARYTTRDAGDPNNA